MSKSMLRLVAAMMAAGALVGAGVSYAAGIHQPGEVQVVPVERQQSDDLWKVFGPDLTVRSNVMPVESGPFDFDEYVRIITGDQR